MIVKLDPTYSLHHLLLCGCTSGQIFRILHSHPFHHHCTTWLFLLGLHNCYGLSKLLSQFLMDMVSDAKVGAAYGSGGPINKARLQTAFVWPADPLLQLTVRRQTQHWQRRKSRCPVINPEVLLPLVHFIITLALWSYCRC